MSGMNKRSSDPKSDQKKITSGVNPLYNTSALIKKAADALRGVTNPPKKEKKKAKK